jgi:Ohr subfamily peroxiredoxin
MGTLYTAVVTAKGGRDGHIRSSDGAIDLNLRKPREMGGKGGKFANPEQLFAGAYGACYLSALQIVADRENVDITEATVDVYVSFDNNYALSAELHVHIPIITCEEAQKLAQKAYNICPYSKATKGNMNIKIMAE